jgi:hypothetical protein
MENKLLREYYLRRYNRILFHIKLILRLIKLLRFNMSNLSYDKSPMAG